eukprot:9619352-Karenia_brevis.AAC.1
MESTSTHRDIDLIPAQRSEPKARPQGRQRSLSPLRRIPPKPETNRQRLERLRKQLAENQARNEA